MYGDDEELTEDELKLLQQQSGEDEPEAEEPEGSSEPEQPEGAEAEAEEASEEEPERGEGQRVPLAELLKERERRKKTEDRFDTFLQRLEQFKTQPQQQAPQQPNVPDKETDPFGYMEYLHQQVASLQQHESYRAQMQQREQARRQFEAELDAEERGFHAKNPDYYERIQFIRDHIYRSALFAGYGQAAAAQEARRQMLATADAARMSGTSPVEYFYRQATVLGYAPQAKPSQAKANGKDKRQAFRSMSDAGGKPTKGKVTAKDLAAMSEDEFTAFMESNKLSASDIDKMLGF